MQLDERGEKMEDVVLLATKLHMLYTVYIYTIDNYSLTMRKSNKSVSLHFLLYVHFTSY